MDERQLRLLRRLRLALLALLVVWFFSPPEWRYAVPLWLPFGVALALEAQFFVVGLRGSGPVLGRDTDRGPQRADLEDLGWPGGEEPEEDDEFWDSAPAPRRRRRRGGALRSLAEAAVVLAVIALVAFAINIRRGWSSLPAETQARVERALSAQARTIAGHRVRVRCDTAGRHVGAVQESDGVAVVGGREAWLTPGICYRLHRVREGHVGSFSATGRAIAVLAHEAWHLRGVADEGVTNCYAFQSGVDVGVRLGLSRSTARGMMRQQLADNPLDAAGDSRYLVPPECRNDGRYDLDRASTAFP